MMMMAIVMIAMLMKNYDQNYSVKAPIDTFALNSFSLSQKSFMRKHQNFHIFGFLVAMTEAQFVVSRPGRERLDL